VPSPADQVQERVKTQQREPVQYKVVLLNDDYTTMEFVVETLEGVFDKSPAEAFRIMMLVHQPISAGETLTSPLTVGNQSRPSGDLAPAG
jgi:ATP-dependent Clp protease adapter protein ClpS